MPEPKSSSDSMALSLPSRFLISQSSSAEKNMGSVLTWVIFACIVIVCSFVVLVSLLGRRRSVFIVIPTVAVLILALYALVRLRLPPIVSIPLVMGSAIGLFRQFRNLR
ncbi:MAG: hypothetical protein MK102_07790 [Fuerstiella sp.]|nr:hypothetical protein [Fuerstiella sp.]